METNSVKAEPTGVEPKRSSPRLVRRELKTAISKVDAECVNSSKTLLNRLSFKTNQLNSHFSKLKESNR